MLARDIQILDLGSDSWSRLFELAGGLLASIPGDKDTNPLLIIYRGLALLRAIDLKEARPVSVDFRGTSRLDALSRETGFLPVIAVEETALTRIIGHAQREIHYRDDYFKQWSAFLRGLSREWKRTIFTYPPGPARLPLVPHGLVDLSIRLLIPDDTIALFVVTENGRAWTSIALGYKNGDFWLLTSLDAVASENADLSDGALERSAEMLRSKYGGTVRVVSVERERLAGILKSRFPAGNTLMAMNSRELRILNIPRRWKIMALTTALAASIKRSIDRSRDL